eukprot:CAMPEP_0172555552 /NCGR_PEP_ID=MMETSP1067-20121228/58554_1 /TAXON_ID=265564 ORGANISM="Thalassiosira punctigera, Strain Tpunct2005C2" /NCGR_SAMPLE_ID=MMETSP1067 /ASSEMBLY_ACC=CAM_ASM_000444 /LENGTH=182 /DNA_ID=CAMNT_0013344079 /DNA_START=180 /DNA_END=728 /DNA_ORIENTATION=+
MTRQVPKFDPVDYSNFDTIFDVLCVEPAQLSVPVLVAVMSLVRSIDSVLPRPPDVNKQIIIGIFVTLLIANAPQEAAHSTVIGLAQDVSAGQGNDFVACLKTNGAGGGDSEYFADVEVAGAYSVTEDVGLGVVFEVAGRAFQRVVLRLTCTHYFMEQFRRFAVREMMRAGTPGKGGGSVGGW